MKLAKFNKPFWALNRALIGAFLALPLTSHATSIESILNKSVNFLSGGVAKSVGVLVLVGAGYMCLVQHKFPKEQLIMMMVGLGIIYGGSSLYGSLIG
jgi:type IV secretion system protein VirB2